MPIRHCSAGDKRVEAIDFLFFQNACAPPRPLLSTMDGTDAARESFTTTPGGFLNLYFLCLLDWWGKKRNVQAPSMHLSNVQFFAFNVTVLLQFVFYLKRTGAQSRWNKAV